MRTSTDFEAGAIRKRIAPINPKIFPMASPSRRPYLSAIQLAISDPVTPPIKNIATTTDQMNSN